MSPAWQQKQLRVFCKEKGIHITAYSPLGASGTKWGDNRVIASDVLEEIAKAKGKTTAQVSTLTSTVSLELTKKFQIESNKSNTIIQHNNVHCLYC